MDKKSASPKSGSPKSPKGSPKKKSPPKAIPLHHDALTLVLLQVHPSELGKVCASNKQFAAICKNKSFREEYARKWKGYKLLAPVFIRRAGTLGPGIDIHYKVKEMYVMISIKLKGKYSGITICVADKYNYERVRFTTYNECILINHKKRIQVRAGWGLLIGEDAKEVGLRVLKTFDHTKSNWNLDDGGKLLEQICESLKAYYPEVINDIKIQLAMHKA